MSNIFTVQRWVLLGVAGSARGQEITLSEDVMFVGRTDDNGIILDTPNVSRQHATLQLRGEKPWIEDLDSKNGTFVNGQAINRVELNVGDHVQMGECEFEVQCLGEISSEADTAPTLGAETLNQTLPQATPPPLVLDSKVFASRWNWLERLGRKRLMLYGSLLFFLVAMGLFLSHQTPRPVAPKKAVITQPSLFKPVIQIPENVTEEDILTWRSRAEAAIQFDDVSAAIPYLRKILAVREDDRLAQIMLEKAEKKLSALINQYYENGVREFDRLYFEKAITEWRKVLSLAADFDPEAYQRAEGKISEAEERLAELH